MRQPWLAFLALGIVLPGAAYSQVLLTPQQIAQRAKGATVQIRSLDTNGRVIGAGSGFFVSSDGLIVTNFHVVEDATSLEIERETGEVFDNVYYVTSDQRRDTVILKIPVSGVASLRLGTDVGVEIGSRVFVMGNPLGQTATFSDGLISARRVVGGVELLQVTAPISPGSSGGPAMNEQGDVIGIATMFLEGGQNLNFLVPIHHVQPMVAMGERPQRFSSEALPGGGERRSGSQPQRSVSQGGRDSAGPGASGEDAAIRLFGGIRFKLDAVEGYMREHGLAPTHEIVWGALKANEYEDTTVNLRVGRGFAAIVLCDSDCTDADLALFGPDGRRLAADLKEDDAPMVAHVPAVTGQYTLRVVLPACSVEPCAYGLQIYGEN